MYCLDFKWSQKWQHPYMLSQDTSEPSATLLWLAMVFLRMRKLKKERRKRRRESECFHFFFFFWLLRSFFNKFQNNIILSWGSNINLSKTHHLQFFMCSDVIMGKIDRRRFSLRLRESKVLSVRFETPRFN